jgi:hypothetical protein
MRRIKNKLNIFIADEKLFPVKTITTFFNNLRQKSFLIFFCKNNVTLLYIFMILRWNISKINQYIWLSLFIA